MRPYRHGGGNVKVLLEVLLEVLPAVLLAVLREIPKKGGTWRWPIKILKKPRKG